MLKFAPGQKKSKNKKVWWTPLDSFASNGVDPVKQIRKDIVLIKQAPPWLETQFINQTITVNPAVYFLRAGKNLHNT